ncbi:MAG: outer membrane beta-barrel protein [Thermodesulfobacteriota bacterium]
MLCPKQTRKILLFCFLTVTTLTSALNVFAEDIRASNKVTADDDLGLSQDVNRQKTFRPVAGRGSSDLLGTSGGYIHPYISLTGLYSDNIYNASTNEENDYLTTISPGLMLAYPGVKDMHGASFRTSNPSPGGLVGERASSNSFHRFQTSLLYQADVESYTDNSSGNMDHHRAEALLQFNLKGGVSFDLAGEYKVSADAFSGSALLDEYQSDLLDLVVGIKLGSRTDLALGYSGFQLDYDALRNDGRDRQDISYSGRLSFDMSAKTAIFAEYQLIDIDYDFQIFPANEIQNGNVGIKWHHTAKSSGQLKIGVSSKSHEDASLADADTDEVFYELQLAHSFSSKTSIDLTGTRRLTESTVAGTNFIINNQVSLNYRQKLSAKIVANLDTSYYRDEFNGFISVGPVTAEREDTTILVTPTIDYLTKDWFIVSLSYSLAERDSNFDNYDFTSNSVFLRLTAYL